MSNDLIPHKNLDILINEGEWIKCAPFMHRLYIFLSEYKSLYCIIYILPRKMRRNILSILLIGIIIVSLSSCSIYDQYMSEARKIAKAMTLEQKIGQTIQITFEGITVKNVTDPSFVEKFQLGSLLVGGNDAPTDDGNVAKLHDYLEEDKNKQIFLNATVQNWKKLADKFKNVGVTVNVDKTKYLVKLLLGTDAVHGDQHSVGNVIFPHNIGLSCSHNAANFENVGFWTK